METRDLHDILKWRSGGNYYFGYCRNHTMKHGMCATCGAYPEELETTT